MPVFSAAYTAAGSPYNIFKVITGAQTTGVTAQTGSKTYPSIPVNAAKIDLTIDPSVAGTVYQASDGTVSATNKVGRPMLQGDSRTIQGEGGHKFFSLAAEWFAVSANGMIVHIEWI